MCIRDRLLEFLIKYQYQYLTDDEVVILMQMDFLHENYEAADGASMPRSIIYSQYLRYCRHRLGNIVPMNPASFGKLLRLVFTGIKTRRLGTRLLDLTGCSSRLLNLFIAMPIICSLYLQHRPHLRDLSYVSDDAKVLSV